jgi:predicted site-specific integrase-resolvase
MFNLLIVDMSTTIIRLKDAPKHFNVSRATIWRWRKQGVVKTYFIGSVCYVNTDDVIKSLPANES